MRLIIDAGNTQTKLALFAGDKIITEKKYSRLLKSSIQSVTKHKHIEAVIFSTVIKPDLKLINYLSSYPFLINLTHKTKIPIKNKYKTPQTLGRDRLANAVGAAGLFKKKNNLVVDAGTCIKYDFINHKNEYLGGGISPGIQMRFDALHYFTDQLPALKIREKFSLVGQSTEESILSGVENGILAEVEAIILQYKKFYKNLNVIFTGGDYLFFVNRLKTPIFAAPQLTLIGLNEILDYALQKR